MAKKEEKFVDNTKVIESTVETIMHKSMMPYSEHVILDRALPRVEDGLKPVQRRILYTMKELGVTPDKPYRKSARIVGDCLGKYHPHGDSSVYGAMVRLAQSFNTRMTLVDGHGNFGSVDGDSPAAMRYTEVKMTPLALELLRDLDKDTVPLTLNFDDTLEEPEILPGRFPNLLVNGAMGIAVGMATNIPPHNLGESIDAVVAYIDNDKISLDEIMQILPGPDFPTGGIIIDNGAIKQVYETGKGKITVRAKTTIEKEGDRQSIVITEIPYQINKQQLLIDINSLRDKKKELYGGIQDIIDESDRHGLRCTIKLAKDANAEKILAGLFKASNLETTFGANMLAIANGKPKLLTLMDYISTYVEYQRNVIFKRCSYDLTAAKAREHILSGLLIAVNNIRAVVEIVLTSDTYQESKDRLKADFDLSEKQAIAVLDVPLKKLNKLDVTKMEEELKELREKIEDLESILNSKRRQLTLVKKELLDIKKRFATPRMTKIINEEDIKIKTQEVIEAVSYKGYLILNQNGNLKFLNEKAHNMSSKGIVNNDASTFVKKTLYVESQSKVIGFTKKGMAVVFTVADVQDDKWKSRGTSISKLGKVDPDDDLITVMTQKELQNNDLFFATKQGMIKRTEGKEFNLDKKSTTPAIILKDDDVLVNVQAASPDTENILFVTQLGNVLNAFNDVAAQGKKATGVKGIKLEPKDYVAYMTMNNQEGEILVVLRNGYAKRVILSTIDPKNRYGKGVTLFEAKKVKDLMMISVVKDPFDFAVSMESGNSYSVNTEDIEISDRTAKGKNIFKVAKIKDDSEIKIVCEHNAII